MADLTAKEAAVRAGGAALPPGVPQAGPQWIISIVAMCWFPLANGETFVRPLGLDPADRKFLSQRKRHIVDLVLRGMGIEPTSAAGQPEPEEPT